MKSSIKKIFSIFYISSLLFSCGNGYLTNSSLNSDDHGSTNQTTQTNPSDSSKTEDDSFALNKYSVEVEVGKTVKINVAKKPDVDGDVIWSIDDTSKARLSPKYNGLMVEVFGLEEGSSIITASIDGTDFIKTVSLTVLSDGSIKVPSIDLNDSMTMKIDMTSSIDATIKNINSDDISWSVGDSSIVSIESYSGATINLKAKSIGDTYVRAEWNNDSSVYDECLIHVVENVLVTWPSISSDAGNYYSSIDFTLEPSKLLTALNSLNRKMKKSCSYKNATEVLKYAEEDPEKPGNVILIYTSESRKYDKSTVNKEHVWPQSRGLSGEAYADPHMLHLADSKENGARGNDIYGEKTDSKCYYVEMDEWKGACARSVMYEHVAYQHLGLVLNEDPSYKKGSSKNMGKISVLLKWDALNPVISSKYEMIRNNRIQDKINNRNPFVDIPGLGLYLYGGINSGTKNIYHTYASQFGLDPTMY